MSSSASRRVFRSELPEEDVVVVGGARRHQLAADGPVTTVSNLLDGAKRRSEQTIAAAESEAAAIVERAQAEASAVREAARQEGLALGRNSGAEQTIDETAELLGLLRAAAAEGLAVRNNVIEDAMPAIARAVAMAARRVIGAAYLADPSLTADACADAVRAAAGQQILSIRVSPDALDTVRASLIDVADYVRADESIEIGGCVIDLRNGSIDATLDARLDLMELALRAAGGAE